MLHFPFICQLCLLNGISLTLKTGCHAVMIPPCAAVNQHTHSVHVGGRYLLNHLVHSYKHCYHRHLWQLQMLCCGWHPHPLRQNHDQVALVGIDCTKSLSGKLSKTVGTAPSFNILLHCVVFRSLFLIAPWYKYSLKCKLHRRVELLICHAPLRSSLRMLLTHTLQTPESAGNLWNDTPTVVLLLEVHPGTAQWCGIVAMVCRVI